MTIASATLHSASEFREAAPSSSGPIIDQSFLGGDSIAAYVAHITEPGAKFDPRFAFLDGASDWPRKGIPLPLCEFLAYKAALAYEDGSDGLENLNSYSGIREAAYFDSQPVGGDTQGYGFILGDIAFIVFRGSASRQDWLDDLTPSPTHAEMDRETLGVVGNPWPPRHLGFARAWGFARGDIEKWIAQWKDKPGNENVKQFCFSGHSLGGALAFLAAYEFALADRPVAAVVTFGAPKVGAKEFQCHYESLQNGELGRRTLRIESPWDAVTRLSLPGSRSVGSRWEIRERPTRQWWWMLGAALFGFGWESVPTSETTSAPRTETPPPKPSANNDRSAKSGSPETPAPQKDAGKDQVSGSGAWQGLLLFLAAVGAYFIVRAIVVRYAAHGVQKRYALYLSTLSYQRLRAFHGSNYATAAKDLDAHLAYVRGASEKPYAALANLPIRVLSKSAEKCRPGFIC